MVSVVRLDFGKIVKVKRTPQGGLRIPAYLTRTGVFRYLRADGTVQKELRPADEVFHADSLESLASAPVTIGHPEARQVHPDNWASLSVGHVAEAVRADGSYVASDLLVQDATAIDRVDARELSELSCGYACEFDATPGEYEGERYDGVQRQIRYNHVALLPKGGGRAGREVALRMDAADAIQISAESPPQRTETMPTKLIKFDGVDLEEGSAQHLQALANKSERLDAERGAAIAERDTAQGERDALQARLDKAEDPKRFAEAVSASVALRADAAKVLGADADMTRSDAELMLDVVRNDDKDFDLNDRSEDYLRGRYESAIKACGRKPVETPADKVRSDHNESRNDGEKTLSPRERMLADNAKASSQPLSYSRSN